MKQVNLKEMDLVQLGNLAYLFICDRENANRNLIAVEQEITLRNSQKPKEPENNLKAVESN